MNDTIHTSVMNSNEFLIIVILSFVLVGVDARATGYLLKFISTSMWCSYAQLTRSRKYADKDRVSFPLMISTKCFNGLTTK